MAVRCTLAGICVRWFHPLISSYYFFFRSNAELWSKGSLDYETNLQECGLGWATRYSNDQRRWFAWMHCQRWKYLLLAGDPLNTVWKWDESSALLAAIGSLVVSSATIGLGCCCPKVEPFLVTAKGLVVLTKPWERCASVVYRLSGLRNSQILRAYCCVLLSAS